MTKDEALKLALKALETPWNAPYVDGCDLALGKKVKAITAIKEALANEALEKMAENARELGLDYEPEPVPVAVVRWNDIGHISWRTHVMLSDDTPLYTTPPQRTWIGLTDEDCDEVERWVEFKEEGSGRIPNLKLIRYIEAKLKEKNT